MARRCGTRNGSCPKPRSNWWKQSLGVDWFNHNVGYDPSYETVLDYLEANAITAPSLSQNSAISTFITGMKSSGLWDRALNIHITGAGSLGFGMTNLKNPGTYQFTTLGTVPTFTDGLGTKSAGAGSCFNTKFRTQEIANQGTNLTTIVDIQEPGSETNLGAVLGAAILTSNAATRFQLQPKISGGVNGSRFHYNTNQVTFGNINCQGLYILTPGTNQAIIYRDWYGCKFTNAITPVTPDLNNDILLLAYNSNLTQGGVTVSSAYTKNVVGYFQFSDQFTDADVTAFANLWVTCRTSLRASTNIWYARPTSQGAGNGTSYADAWAFSSIDQTVIKPGDTLYIAGACSGILSLATGRITIRLDYPGDPGSIDATGQLRAISSIGLSHLTIYGGTYSGGSSDGILFDDSGANIICNNVHIAGSGNQGFQNQGKVQVTYNSCISENNTDDGWSGHTDAVFTLNNCISQNNTDGINCIANAIVVCNDSQFIDNTGQVISETTADMTFNRCHFQNGSVNGSSSVPIKFNQCTFDNVSFSGNYVIS